MHRFLQPVLPQKRSKNGAVSGAEVPGLVPFSFPRIVTVFPFLHSWRPGTGRRTWVKIEAHKRKKNRVNSGCRGKTLRFEAFCRRIQYRGFAAAQTNIPSGHSTQYPVSEIEANNSCFRIAEERGLMSTAKETMSEIIARQPEDSSYEEIMRELAYARMVERGLADADAGRTVTQREVRSRVDSWQK
jgi:hypothetical protein